MTQAAGLEAGRGLPGPAPPSRLGSAGNMLPCAFPDAHCQRSPRNLLKAWVGLPPQMLGLCRAGSHVTLGPGIGQSELPLGSPGKKVTCRLSHLGPLCLPVIGTAVPWPMLRHLPLPRFLPASLFSVRAHSTPEMLPECPEQPPWQWLDSQGLLPPPVPRKLAQAVQHTSGFWPGPPGSPSNPQGPGAEEVRRVGSPLSCGSVCPSFWCGPATSAVAQPSS